MIRYHYWRRFSMEMQENIRALRTSPLITYHTSMSISMKSVKYQRDAIEFDNFWISRKTRSSPINFGTLSWIRQMLFLWKKWKMISIINIQVNKLKIENHYLFLHVFAYEISIVLNELWNIMLSICCKIGLYSVCATATNRVFKNGWI